MTLRIACWLWPYNAMYILCVGTMISKHFLTATLHRVYYVWEEWEVRARICVWSDVVLKIAASTSVICMTLKIACLFTVYFSAYDWVYLCAMSSQNFHFLKNFITERGRVSCQNPLHDQKGCIFCMIEFILIFYFDSRCSRAPQSVFCVVRVSYQSQDLRSARPHWWSVESALRSPIHTASR